MMQRKTVVVVGAGASSEVGIPVGSKLKDDIARILDIRFDEHGLKPISGDMHVLTALKIAVEEQEDSRDINPHLRAAWAIRDAMPQALSIDNYIDAHNGDAKIELCGKLAITRSILEAEQSSKIYLKPNSRKMMIKFEIVQNTWLNKFVQILTENCRLEDVPARLSSVVFIVFNYDRCIEHFLYYALQNYYRISTEKSAELLQNLTIFHPYGQVGNLPWQNRGASIEFGSEPHPGKLLELSHQIRTFNEGTDPELSDIQDLRSRLASGEILLFLGYAYHRLNMELLKTGLPGVEGAICIGTAKGISSPDCDFIRRDIKKITESGFKEPMIRNQLTCTKLFDEYWRTLSIG